jgi:hypothetical protein
VVDVRVRLVVVLRVHHQRQVNLLDIAQTLRLARLGPRAGENGKENRRQNRDDCYHNKQLYEGETFPAGTQHAYNLPVE